MIAPLVSVCLPNLNTRPFLQERADTLFAQTLSNWELVVSDNYSEDGAWEFFKGLARADERVRIAQAPREGMYANWNACIRRARGKYVYIATSDDTMAPNCLERLVAALERHSSCDIAHCPLKTIDELGRDVDSGWSRDSVFAVSSGPLLLREHVRTAPFDGLLHLLGGSVYVSITQLLIRRSLFDRIGYFEPQWGSIGDFNWNMRAGLIANTVHLPDTWGGWRVHSSQATSGVAFSSAEHRRKVDEMIDYAITASEALLAPGVRQPVRELAADARELRHFVGEVAARSRASAVRRLVFLARRVLGGSAPAREYVKGRLLRRPLTDWVRDRLDAADFRAALLPATSSAGPNRTSPSRIETI